MGASVEIGGSVLSRYERFSLYNSPYPAHDYGCAIDLYPGTDVARSPVSGTVIDTLSVRCPDQPYAVSHDHLIVISVDDGVTPTGTDEVVARILHVDPAVSKGDDVAIGDRLGTLVRSGFFGQWVANHIHLDFRTAAQNPYRASGSVPLTAAVDVAPIDWDGTGTVVETGPTHALLSGPTHPQPGSFAAIASDEGVALDGGLSHYGGGGILSETDHSAVSLFGTDIATVSDRDLVWNPIDILANGERITGLSLFADQTGSWGAKLVTIGQTFDVGTDVRVTIEPSEDPIRLGGRT
ncbi:hypothetical protein [Natronocalculus amylovorans]|uniref:Peptidase M23 domain-containing protein n=1 Tax=Natronocalculus amylovorans TaxID=2917812 RepID=A0AAE3FXK1_9EURY|nr:hypothetical protein [Natronocalculus amylovorans]MCL9816873.1 hypothetical protein [Natronocalculus amylovorans]